MTVLVIDYPGRRVESRIRDLRLEDAGWDVRYLLDEPMIRELTSRDFARRLVERHRPVIDEVTAVLAYCSAAPIAQDFVALLGDPPVPLVIFDGEPSPPENLTRDFGYAAADLYGVSTVDEVPGGVATLTSAALSATPDECVDLMRGRLVDLAIEVLRADGADPDEAATAGAASAEFYLDWLVYLVAAHNTTWPSWGGVVFHVASGGHPYTPFWRGSSATYLRRVASGRNDLFHHPDVRRHTLEFLAAEAATPTGLPEFSCRTRR